MPEKHKKEFAMRVRLSFEGVVKVAATDKKQAKAMVEQHFGMVMGGSPHHTLPSEDISWDFPTHPRKEIRPPCEPRDKMNRTKGYKWELVKSYVAGYAASKVRDRQSWETYASVLSDLLGSDWEAVRQLPKERRHCEAILESYAAQVSERIMAWDIRGMARLRALFPSGFPSGLRRGKLDIEQGDTDWIIYRRGIL